MKKDQDFLNILRRIDKTPNVSQRALAKGLGFSLGKLNYCLKALKDKGLIKIRNFTNNPKKINYVYILTPEGISKKTSLALRFMEKKMKEYDELASELKKKK